MVRSDRRMEAAPTLRCSVKRMSRRRVNFSGLARCRGRVSRFGLSLPTGRASSPGAKQDPGIVREPGRVDEILAGF